MALSSQLCLSSTIITDHHRWRHYSYCKTAWQPGATDTKDETTPSSDLRCPEIGVPDHGIVADNRSYESCSRHLDNFGTGYMVRRCGVYMLNTNRFRIS
jgi:hypothetical protein